MKSGTLLPSPVPSKVGFEEVGVTTKFEKKMLRVCRLVANVGIPIFAIIFILGFFSIGLFHSMSKDVDNHIEHQ